MTDARLEFFKKVMLDFVALKQRPEVEARLDVAIQNGQSEVSIAIAKYYVSVLADLLPIAQDTLAVAAVTAIKDAWETVVAGAKEPEWAEMATNAFNASHTGSVLLGPDQGALDMIVARAAARSTGVVSEDPRDRIHFSDEHQYDGPEFALGNVGRLAALAIAKDPKHERHASILPETHTVDGKFDVGSFTKTRAQLYSDTIIKYIDKLIEVL